MSGIEGLFITARYSQDNSFSMQGRDSTVSVDDEIKCNGGDQMQLRSNCTNLSLSMFSSVSRLVSWFLPLLVGVAAEGVPSVFAFVSWCCSRVGCRGSGKWCTPDCFVIAFSLFSFTLSNKNVAMLLPPF